MLFSATRTVLLLTAAFLTPVYSAPMDLASRGSKASSTSHSGDGTFYQPGLGACGTDNTSHDLIVAVSHTLFDSYPGANPSNPNKNPICGKKLRATYGAKSVIVAVKDRCIGCATGDLDFTSTGFGKLASLDKGRIHGVKWQWV
ncbi:RlpA-like double-psi beta-barrel-protein domain-containing protein-containing protein [Mycena metata]|uniref:RlpA-like double-psi beta-barrel-protein domain-containing protein-containing protein n=1 Tax=Mycena metata TaxID=1033252 RepID=A0AAD7MFS9_9AGAR|nr:RlpA-like double-psi beta-barrel-protein domain-containing protein-containing protein [Mycena metata]